MTQEQDIDHTMMRRSLQCLQARLVAVAHPLKTLSGGEWATNSVSMASSVPALGASSGPSGWNVAFLSFALLCCSESECKVSKLQPDTQICTQPAGYAGDLYCCFM